MKLLSGIIAICSAFWMHIYLYGLEETSSAGFNNVFYFYAGILFLFGVFSIFLSFKENRNK